MSSRAVWAIVRRDITVVLQSKSVLVPLIVVPLMFLVGIPALAGIVGSAVGQQGANLANIGSFLSSMPAGMREELALYNPSQQFVVLILLYMLAPLYLIIPLMVSSVIAADSFAGEKERKTLEALLYTPTSDQELVLAKMLAAWLPAVAIGLAGFVTYGLVANLASWPVMGRIFFPNPAWVALALWVGPAIAGFGLGITVLVSAGVRTFQEAYQLGGVVVIPVVMLMVAQASGVMYFSVALVLLLGLGVWSADAVLLWYGVRTFRRGEIIARL